MATARAAVNSRLQRCASRQTGDLIPVPSLPQVVARAGGEAVFVHINLGPELNVMTV